MDYKAKEGDMNFFFQSMLCPLGQTAIYLTCLDLCWGGMGAGNTKSLSPGPEQRWYLTKKVPLMQQIISYRIVTSKARLG